jgi:trehalose 6-phosphate synthase/phosphatase
MLVTPVRDGMNLVAKEFVATRSDEDGVLVLSEFAGAAAERVDAVLVNPYDVDGTGERIHQALTCRPRSARVACVRCASVSTTCIDGQRIS